jgi:hypothetical protein
MRTYELRFFMTPAEVRDRLRAGMETLPDPIFVNPSGGAFLKVKSIDDIDWSASRRSQVFVGEIASGKGSILDIEPGKFLVLHVPTVRGNDLTMADLGMKVDLASLDADDRVARFHRWSKLFRSGLRPGTTWHFLGLGDNPPDSRKASERYSPGALDLFQAGGRWVQSGVPHQEWRPEVTRSQPC